MSSMPPGISLATATEMAAELRKVVRRIPRGVPLVSQLGRNDDGTDPWTPSHIEAGIGLTPYEHLAGGRDQAGSGPAHDGAASTNCRASRSHVSQPIIDSVHRQGLRPAQPARRQVFGDDFNELRRIGKDIINVLEDDAGR